MEKKEFNFWQDHSLRYLEMAFDTDRREVPANPDGYGKRTGDCGDTVEMFLKMAEGRIASVAFETNGCVNTAACANTAAHLAEGKTPTEAWEIAPEDVIAYLETLPPQNQHCAELAVGALYLALRDLKATANEPWKRAYRKH
jgi:nitrogen fixation NifU-like protein